MLNKNINVMTLNELISRETSNYVSRCETVKNDYAAGCRDCKNGVYDKFYRYHRNDDGFAYDTGWYNTNKTVQVEFVTFI